LIIFKKGIDKTIDLWYNIPRYPKTAGSRKSASHPAEEESNILFVSFSQYARISGEGYFFYEHKPLGG
jgi:hypothetical protein